MKRILFIMIAMIIMGTSYGQLTGTKTIPGDYATLALAISDLNAVGVGAGGVTFNVAAGYTETITAPLSITATGTLANQIIFQKSGIGANPLITAYVGTATPASAVQDGIWNLIGSDYVTLDGIDLIDPNTTNPATMEYGYAMFKASVTDGCQYNTIKNCVVTLSRNNNVSGTSPAVEGSRAINIMNAIVTAQTTVLTPTAASGTNSFNKFYTNTLQNCNYGIALIGYAGTSPFTLCDFGNDIGGSAVSTGNSIINYGGAPAASNPSAAVRTLAQYDLNVSYNTINNNNGSGVNHIVTLRGIYLNTAVSASATISRNTLTIQSGTTAANQVSVIENVSGGTGVGNTININYNTITGGTNSTTTTGIYYCIYNQASAATLNINYNLISANTIAGTSTTPFIETGSPTTANVNNNQIINNTRTGASGTWYLIKTTSPTNLVVNNNLIDNNTWTNAASTGTTAGIWSASSAVNVTVNNNTIKNLSTPTTGTITGIREYGISGLKTFIGNQIYNISTGGAGTIYGFSISAGTTIDVSKNNIYNLASLSGAGAFVYGIYITTGSPANIYNNFVSDLRALAATGTNAINGIYISGGTTVNSYYNTVYLNASSSGATFGSSAMYASTTPTVDLKNNNFINVSTPAGTGVTAAYRRSGTLLTSYASTSNYNNFYAGGTEDATHAAYYDGATAYNFAAFQTLVGPTRDAVSFRELPPFVNVAATPYDLKMQTTVSTKCESGGVRITTPAITDDYQGDIRFGETGYAGTGSSPDVGADEFNGIPSFTCAAPAPGNTLASSTAICSGQSVTLSLQNSTSGTGVSYQWKSSPDGITYSSISGATGATASVTPIASTYYLCYVTCQNGPVTTVSNPVQVTFANAITSTTPGARCGTGTVDLQATGSAGTLMWYAGQTGGASVGTGSPWTTPSISATTTYYVGAETTSPGNASIGSASTQTSSSGYPTAFGNYNYQYWIQMVYTAAELNAAGLSAGNITSVKFNVGVIPDGTNSDYMIKIGTTPSTTLSTFTTTGLTTVFGPATPPTIVVGLNTITFTTPYNWDGASNIIIDIRGTGANASVNANTYYTTASNTVVYAYSFSSAPAFWTSSPSATTSSSRLNVILAGQSSCSSPRSAVVATVSTAPALTVTASQTVCNNAVGTVSVTSNLSDFNDYIWSPNTNLFTDAACTAPYINGTSIATVYVKTATAAVTTYTCTSYNSTTLCSNVATSTVTTLPVPVITATPASLCVSGTSTITTSPTTGFGTSTAQWQMSTDNITFNDVTGGTVLSYTTPTISATTYYKLILELGLTECTASNVATITVNNPSVASTTPGTRCGTGTVSLAATGSSGSTLRWYAASTGGTAIGTGSPFTSPSISATTTYYVGAESSPTMVGTIGAGALTSSYSYASPFYHSYGGVKSQFLITAAELTAAGLAAGSISAMSYNITTAGIAYNGFNLSIGNTALSALTSTLQTGLTTVYSTPSLTPTVGTFTINFGSSFVWDGISNIIVETCWSNNNGGGTSAELKYDNTTFTSGSYWRADTQTPATICGTSGAYGTLSVRPQMIFTIAGCSSPRSVVLATVTTPPSVTATATPTAVCAGSPSTLEATSLSAGYTYSWSPATVPPTGATVAATPSAATTYTVTANDVSGGPNNGCATTATVSVAVNPVPSALTVNPASATICTGAIQSLTANGGTLGGSGTIGTGTVSNTTTTPYKGFYGGNKNQYLFTAAELTAMGLTSGTPISAISFSISAFTGPYTFLNFNIGMKNTASTVMTGIETGVTTVLAPATYTLSGTAPFTVSHTLTTPFTWDGVSSLLVETCFVNADGGGSSSNSANVVSSSTTNVLGWYYSNDTETTVCSAPGIGSSSYTRPNITFTYSTPTTITWSPNSGLYTDAGATNPYTGTAAITVYTKPASDVTYTATATTGASCTTTGTSSITITNPAAPTVGTITQPTCTLATGSVVLNDLPATGTWTINPGGITGSGTTHTITGLATGTHNFTYTNSVSCTSVLSADVVINAQPATPGAPTVGTITQPTCAVATGSVVLNNLPATGTWTINPGGITGSGTTHTITGLATGTHNYTVTNSLTCTSVLSGDVVINAQPPTPVVSDQSTSILSGATFSITPAGTPSGTTYTWTAPSYTGGVTGGAAETTPQTSIGGTLSVPSGSGTAIYTVTPTTGACVGATFTATVNVTSTCDAVAVATHPSNASMCATTGSASFTVSASGTAPFVYAWQYDNGGTWGAVVNGTPAGAVYTNQSTVTLGVSGITAAGSPQYRCYITNCSGNNNATSNAATLTVNPLPSAPTVGTITQPSCILATGSVDLTGLPSGSWTINPGGITGSGTTHTISGLATGTHNYSVTDALTCSSGLSGNIVINAQPITPDAPYYGAITQPSCASATGSAVIDGLPATGTWTINPGGITGSGTSHTVTGITVGSHTYTVTNASSCTSAASPILNINAAGTPTAPTTLVANTITGSSAVLGWTVTGSEAKWQISYGVTPTTAAAGTKIVTTLNPYTLNGLTAQTSYDFFVRAICASGDTSLWSVVKNFTTPCSSVTVFPFTESFDGTTFAPDCWTNVQTTGTPSSAIWTRVTAGSNPTTAPHSGAAMASFPCYTYSLGKGANLITKPLNLPSDFYRVSFWMNKDVGYPGNKDSVNVYLNNQPNTTGATYLGTVYRSTSFPAGSVAGWNKFVYNFPAGSAGAGKYVVFAGGSKYGNNIFIDDVTIDLQPSCNQPTAVSATPLSTTSASIGWTNGGTETKWRIAYSSTIGFDPETAGTKVYTTSNPTIITTLTANTTYQYYVRALCSVSDSSFYSGPFTFTTLCGSVTALPYTENFDVTIGTIPSCWSKSTLTGTTNWGAATSNDGCPSPHTGTAFMGKAWTSATPTSDALLVSPQFALTGVTTNPELKIWIYRNADGIISDSISFYVNTAQNLSGATRLGSVITNYTMAPVELAEGWYEYTFEVPASYNTTPFFVITLGTTTSAWTSYGLGMDDFLLREKPSCAEPFALTVNSTTSTTATVSWTTGGASNWNIEYGPLGFTIGTGTVIHNVTNPYTITGLAQGTTYDFYVRDSCSASDVSPPAGPQFFVTGCGTHTVFPWVENFEGPVFPPACWDKIAQNVPMSWVSSAVYSHSPTHSAAVLWDYLALQNEQLLTPKFDFSTLANPIIDFWYMTSNYDTTTFNITLWASTDGGSTWTKRIWSKNKDVVSTGVWLQRKFDLTLYAGQTNMRFKFQYTGDNGDDFYLDDVSIKEGSDLAVTFPKGNYQLCNLTSTYPISMHIKNIGSKPVAAGEKIYTYYKIDALPLVKDSTILASSLVPNDSVSFTFTTTVDLSAYQLYNYITYISYYNDIRYATDTTKGSIEHMSFTFNPWPTDTIHVTSLPYLLKAGYGYNCYRWNNNGLCIVADSNHSANTSGWQKVRVKMYDNCNGVDSVYINLVTGIDENNAFGNLSIFPNPTTGKFTLTISGVNEKVKLSVVSTHGQEIYTDEFYATYNGTSRQIDLSALPKGIYFIKLANDNAINVKKVVVY